MCWSLFPLSFMLEEWKRSLVGGFDGEKGAKPAPDRGNDLVVLVRSVGVDVLLPNPKGG